MEGKKEGPLKEELRLIAEQAGVDKNLVGDSADVGTNLMEGKKDDLVKGGAMIAQQAGVDKELVGGLADVTTVKMEG